MNVGSLFAGIGGFDLGFERAGMQTLWQVEQNGFRRSVLARHFPNAQRFDDVREVGAFNLERVDLICGGFPCQDISLAGRGEGIDGARSGLWSEFARIIRELEPRWVVVENVPALTSRGLDRVLRDLAASGYDAEWDCLPASAFGAPHRRDRIWVIAYPQQTGVRLQPAGLAGSSGASVSGDDGSQESLAHTEGEPERPGLRTNGSGGQRRSRSGNGSGDVADAQREGQLQPQGSLREVGRRPGDSGSKGGMAHAHSDGRSQGLRQSTGGDERQGAADALGSGELQDSDECALQPWRVGGRATQAGGAEWWAAEPPVGRVAHGVPDRLDQLAALGDALVPQIAEWIGRRILSYDHLNHKAQALSNQKASSDVL